MLSEDLLVPILDDLRATYDGPLALAQDLMVLNVTKDRITQRKAVLPDLAWPAPAHHAATDTRPPMNPNKLATLSPFLQEAEIPVEGVDTEIKG
jgi:ribonuclease Z